MGEMTASADKLLSSVGRCHQGADRRVSAHAPWLSGGPPRGRPRPRLVIFSETHQPRRWVPVGIIPLAGSPPGAAGDQRKKTGWGNDKVRELANGVFVIGRCHNNGPGG